MSHIQNPSFMPHKWGIHKYRDTIWCQIQYDRFFSLTETLLVSVLRPLSPQSQTETKKQSDIVNVSIGSIRCWTHDKRSHLSSQPRRDARNSGPTRPVLPLRRRGDTREMPSDLSKRLMSFAASPYSHSKANKGTFKALVVGNVPSYYGFSSEAGII